MNTNNKGIITQIVGPVVDISFKEGVPNLKNALIVKRADGTELVLEVAQHLGFNDVRSVAMSSTDGLTRGVEVYVDGEPLYSDE
jgi:F-type H+-transporting ATPase subunit beta